MIELVTSVQLDRPIAQVCLHPAVDVLLAVLADTLEVVVIDCAVPECPRTLFHISTADETGAEPTLPTNVPCLSLACHPTTGTVAMGRTFHAIQCWSVASQQRLPDLDRVNYAPLLFFSPSGALLFAADWIAPGKFGRCDAKSYTMVYRWDGYQRVGRVKRGDTCAAHHPGEEFVAFAANDQGYSRIRFLGMSDETVAIYKKSIIIHQDIEGLCFSPDGKLLAAICDNRTYLEVSVYQFPECKPLSHLEYRLDYNRASTLPGFDYVTRQIVFGADSRTLYFMLADYRLGGIDAYSGDLVRQGAPHAVWASSLAARLDRGLLATGGLDGVVNLWSVGRSSGFRQGKLNQTCAFAELFPTKRELVLASGEK